MADNYLENQYEAYLARKAAMAGKGKRVHKVAETLPERHDTYVPDTTEEENDTVKALRELLGAASAEAGNCFREQLYDAAALYAGYRPGQPDSARDCYDTRVYHRYLATGGNEAPLREQLARTLHDYSQRRAMREFLSHYDERRVVGIMGGHGLLRSDAMYRSVVEVSKRLTEQGFLMVSGGGPGAMEATHLGAWMAGRSEAELEQALQMLLRAPSFRDRLWLETAFRVMLEFPQERFASLGVPTWFYGHEPATPFATHIAKLFDNSLREDDLLTLAKGGIVYSPGSAGTMQEIFQDAVQNHYLSFGYASPMIFLGKRYWTEEMPVFPLMQHLVKTGKYQNLILSLTDDVEEIVRQLQKFLE